MCGRGSRMVRQAGHPAARHDGGMWTDQVRVLDDVTPADWLAERMAGRRGTVTQTVPSGFAAYARILHPAGGPDNEPVTWAQVAETTGRQVHPTVQWHALVGAADVWDNVGGLWPHARPQWGNLAIPQLAALCEVLAVNTTTPDGCFFGLWEGWAQLHGSPAVAHLGSDEPVPSALTDTEHASPRLRLPGRDYFVMHGPISATLDFAWYDGVDAWWSQSPNLFWPQDRAWCVATEIDFDCTLVGGSAAAIAGVLEAPELEAWPVRPTDSLAGGADRVNG